MDHQKYKIYKIKRRHRRARAKIFGTNQRPRLAVFRSNKHIYLQAIDDEKGKTIASASDLGLNKDSKLKNNKEKGKGKIGVAKKVGECLAKKLIEKKIKRAVFDRGGYKYHGRIKAAAEGVRAGGVEF